MDEQEGSPQDEAPVPQYQQHLPHLQAPNNQQTQQQQQQTPQQQQNVTTAQVGQVNNGMLDV